MKTELQIKIETLRNELRNLGTVLPGKVGQQYNVCGKADCRCKDPVNPQKHGPYNQLSYSLKGKGSTKFIRPEDVEFVKGGNSNWARMKELEKEIGEAALELLSKEGVAALSEIDWTGETAAELSRQKSEARIRELEKRCAELEDQRERWKQRASDHSEQLALLRVKVNDLSESRDKWKHQYQELNASLAEGAQKKSTGRR